MGRGRTVIDNPVAVIRDGVAEQHIDTILSRVDPTKFQAAGTYSGRAGDGYSDTRKTVVQWMQDETEVKDICLQLFRNANMSYTFDIYENLLECHYLEYHGAHRQDKFTRHQDVIWNANDNIHRKMSLSIQLSNSNDYEGGDLIIHNGGFYDHLVTRRKGTVVMFPSFIEHEVTTVTSGVRKVLVAWISGPRWR
jgi:PKHD-type hydroxylase